MVEQPYDSEDVLQDLLATHPQLLSGGAGATSESTRQWLLVRREHGVPDQTAAGGRWSIDHVFIDRAAVSTLVEVKRSTDTRIRREVVGQMLDYAANGVVYWSQGSLRQEYEVRCSELDDDPVVTLSTALGPDIEYVPFWERVEQNLRTGRIRMVFVADFIPRELRRVIEFLNEQMARAEVLGVEIKRYRSEAGLMTLVPSTIGETEQALTQKEAPTAPPPSHSYSWDYYEERLPASSYSIARELFRRIERYVEEHQLPWTPALRRGYITLLRAGDYGTVGINLRAEGPNPLWIKAVGDPDTLQDEGGAVDSLCPGLAAEWDGHNHQLFWRVPTLQTVPDVAPALDFLRTYMPESRPMALGSTVGPR